MSQQTYHDASFIVRIWWENRDQGTEVPIWRGQAQHVASGEVTGFRSIGELWEFLRRWTDVPAQGDRTPSDTGSNRETSANRE